MGESTEESGGEGVGWVALDWVLYGRDLVL